ncbi:MAG: VWA domain-containing protein [Bacteroidetes bacterium]|nr:VWA domain-containing protein [Bacteroidota bacterium]
MEWYSPQWLWCLLVVPLTAWLWAEGPRLARRLSSSHALGKQVPAMAWGRWALKLIALAGILVACAGPYTTVPPTDKPTQLQIYFVLDASASMDVRDTGPQTRLELARQVAMRLADSLKGHRMGCIGFADFAYTYVPLSDDHAALKLHLNDIRSDQFSSGRTHLRQALQQVTGHFLAESDTSRPWQAGGRVVLLFTDGETVEPPYASKLKLLRDMAVPVIPVTVGSESGGLVPGMRNPLTGAPALSRPAPQRMDSLARELGSSSFRLSSQPTPEWIARVLQAVRDTPPQAPSVAEGGVEKPLFPLPLTVAALSLLATLWLKPTRK